MSATLNPICIASPHLDIYSETFIRTHLNHLNFQIHKLSGLGLDMVDGSPLQPSRIIDRVFQKSMCQLKGLSHCQLMAERRISWLSKSNVKVVLAEFGTTGLKLFEECQKAGVPLVVHFHGADAHAFRYSEGENGERYKCMFKQVSAVIGVSNAMCDRLINELGAPKHIVHYVPYFIDPEKFLFGSPDKASPILLSIGRFVEKKAPHLTILAFSKLLESVPEATLEMVGDGPLLGACQWLARSLGLSDKISFQGVRSHEWVSARMQNVRAFVQHSVQAIDGDCEGTPVAVLEAQCSGLPVVSTRHTGIADVVVEEETGLLCDEGDLNAMSTNMAKILKMNGEEIRQMSRMARARIETAYSRNNTIDRLANIINKVAGNP